MGEVSKAEEEEGEGRGGGRRGSSSCFAPPPGYLSAVDGGGARGFEGARWGLAIGQRLREREKGTSVVVGREGREGREVKAFKQDSDLTSYFSALVPVSPSSLLPPPSS